MGEHAVSVFIMMLKVHNTTYQPSNQLPASLLLTQGSETHMPGGREADQVTMHALRKSSDCKAVGHCPESHSITTCVPSPGPFSVVPCAVYWTQKRCTVRGWGPLSCPNVFTPFPRTYAPRAAETTTPGPGQPTHYHPQLTAIEMIPYQVSPLR